MNKFSSASLIVIALGVVCCTSGQSTSTALLSPYITVESGNIKFYSQSATILPTQYLEISLESVQPNSSYVLQYNSPTIGIKKYPLCSTRSAESSCLGQIALSSLLVYNSGDTFVILQNNVVASNPESGELLIQSIVNAKQNTTWTDFSCGLTSVAQQPPISSMCTTSSVVNKFSLNISNGCNSDDNPELINANAAVYWPDKFTINNYGITCTGIPIAESWVITAGHCVGANGSFYQPGVKIYVSLGSAKLPIEIPESQIQFINNAYEVESIYLLKAQGKNENCNNKCSVYADIALLNIKNHKFSNFIPLVSKSESIIPLSKGIISGFGMHNESNIIGTIRNGRLNYRDAYFMGESDSIVYSAGTLPDVNQYSWKFTGFGDSGGPMFIKENNQLKLLGTLTGGSYLDGYSGVNCIYPGGQNEYASMRYWGETITTIINGTADPMLYNVTN